MSVVQPGKKEFPSETAVKSQSRQIYGTGEMADLTRAYDWSVTPVGPIEQWPEALLTTVNTILCSRHPMFLWWGEERIQFYNDAYRPSIREDKHPSALGQPGKECWAEIWPIIGPQIEAVMARGEATWHEDQLVPIFRNGKLEDVYWTYGYSPVHSGGEIGGVLVVCTETTATVQARLLMQHEMERLANLFQQAPAFFAVLNGPRHVFELLNPLYQELIGRRDIIGKTVGEAVPEAEQQGFIALLDRVYRTGESFVGHSTPIQLARGPARDLEMRYLDFVYQPRRDSKGNINGIIVLGVDVTEGKRAEEVLLQSEKLNAVGRLASSIAHEINNPLESVTNLIYLAQQASINPQAKEYLTTAEIELRRVSAIANQTLRFHRQATRATPTTAADLIDNAVPIYQARVTNANVRVERRDRSSLAVTCFDGEIRQVISNLIANAIDAMSPAGGLLLLRSRESTDWRSGRKGIIITVADTGSGIPADIQENIFEPFFTTKGMQGTGLGLWISHEIVERHRGVLRVRSSQRQSAAGTVFQLFLPCDPTPSEALNSEE
jgi:signal transduction histidine kinase